MGGILMGIGMMTWMYGIITRDELNRTGAMVVVLGGGACILIGSFL